MKKVLTVLMVALLAVSVFAAWEVKADFGPEFLVYYGYDGEESITEYNGYNGFGFDIAGRYYVYDGIRLGAKAELLVAKQDFNGLKVFCGLATAGYGYDFGKFTLGADLGLGFAKTLGKDWGPGLKAMFMLDAELEGSYEVSDMVAIDFGLEGQYARIKEEGEKIKFGLLKPFAGVTVKF